MEHDGLPLTFINILIKFCKFGIPDFKEKIVIPRVRIVLTVCCPLKF